MTLKILHVLDHSIPLHSGYAFRTLSILREQHKLGWETLQVTTPKQGESSAAEESVDGLRFFRTPPEAARAGLVGQMRATAVRLRQAIDSFQPDLIHAHSPVLTVLPALRVARRAGLPVVYEVRAAWEDAAVDHGSTTAGSARYRLSRAAETFALRRADHVTVICEGLRQEIVSRGLSTEKITVIPNGVDIDRFEFRTDPGTAMREQLGLGTSATLGFIGSFYGYEGLDILLAAMARMMAAGDDVQALLVGGGPEDERLRQMTQELGLTERVHFTGRVNHDEVQSYYDAIDLLVYPRKHTRLTEMVTPLKPLEAMAQGKLVVASDVGGHRELIRPEDTGTLFAADDPDALVAAVRTMLADRGGWNAMRQRGREFVANERNWAASATGYRRAYPAALAKMGRTAPWCVE